MVSRTINKKLDMRSLGVVREARELALRTTEDGVVDGRHLLFIISVMGQDNTDPITNALLIRARLTKTAIMEVVPSFKTPGDVIVRTTRKGFDPSLEIAWVKAEEIADSQGSKIKPAHILYGLFCEASMHPEGGFAKLLNQLSPNLDLQVMMDAIVELLNGTDRIGRATALDVMIDRADMTAGLWRVVRHQHIYIANHTP